MKDITNIHVDFPQDDHARAVAGWEQGGLRYHVWFDTRTLEIQRDLRRAMPAIYKNPAPGIEHGQVGHFWTRLLDATTKENAQIVAHVFDHITRNDLVAKAIADRKEKRREHYLALAEEARVDRVKDAGPELLEVLRGILDGGIADPEKVTAAHTLINRLTQPQQQEN